MFLMDFYHRSRSAECEAVHCGQGLRLSILGRDKITTAVSGRTLQFPLQSPQNPASTSEMRGHLPQKMVNFRSLLKRLPSLFYNVFGLILFGPRGRLSGHALPILFHALSFDLAPGHGRNPLGKNRPDRAI
jgi:hypothetical protein